MCLKLETFFSINTNMDLPSNHGQYWTKIQEEHLLLRIGEGMSLEEICIIQSRKVSALIGRLGKISYDLYLEGKSIMEINSITKLPIDDIKIAIRRYDSRKSKLTVNKKLDLILNRLEQLEKNLNTKNI